VAAQTLSDASTSQQRRRHSNAWCTTGLAIVRKLRLTGPHSARPLR